VAALLVVLGAVLASGCGREYEPDLIKGKELFIGKGTCGSCHALERAGTRGTQGPDLDQAFGTARRNGLGEQTVEGIVHEQIANVRRGSIMPENLVKGDDARDVAAYVAFAAGKGGKDTGPLAEAGAPDVSNVTAEAKGGKLQIDAVESGALSFTAGKATAPAGEIELVMANPSPIQHNIAVEGDGTGPVVGTDGTSTVKASLKPGMYQYLCTVPGHAEGGMVGQLTVE